MSKNRSAYHWFGLVSIVSMLVMALAGCTGDTGATGPAGPPGPPGSSAAATPANATELNMTITSVSVNSAPVVNFTVTNQDGAGVSGFADTDFRFNIAKLNPMINGAPSTWQNYIVRASGGAMQGSQERANNSSYPWGSLVDHKDGTYTYTFCTDITKTGTPDFSQCATASQPDACPAPCTDADGNPLDITYQPTLTTRVGIQMSNSAYPKVNATYDFVPAGGTVTSERIVVNLANCNECHNQLTAHGTRIDTKLCVTCHNPGSWVAGTPNTTVDFKVMIHKIHMGENLPSVQGGTPYTIGNADFSDVVFPQDIRNCTKCHTNTDTDVARNTPQGDNWETVPSTKACGSCHDNVDFSQLGPPNGTDPNGHPGGDVSTVTDSSVCLGCHQTNKVGLSIAEDHTIPTKVAAAKFQYNVVGVTGGTMPSISFSVTDPTNGNATYDITADPEFTSSASRLAIDVGWNTADFNNNGSGANPAQVISVSPIPTCGGPGTATAGWSCTVSSGVYTLTATSPLPGTATGTGRFGIEGHPAVPSDPLNAPTVYDLSVPVTSVVADFAITDSSPVARRVVVDIANCDKCHDVLSLHGGNRVNQPQLCVMCHNPNDTDAGVRPKNANGVLDGTLTVDGLPERSIDFKRLVHSIHAADMRENAFVVYGYGGSVHDFSDVRFPGILNDCMTCHTTKTVGRTTYGTYELVTPWDTPTQNGILASTVRTTPTATDATTYATQLATPDDDLNITPTAAVCSSCHDSQMEQNHMASTGSALFSATQATIDGNYETCAICHGPGGIVDVKVVHGVK